VSYAASDLERISSFQHIVNEPYEIQQKKNYNSLSEYIISYIKKHASLHVYIVWYENQYYSKVNDHYVLTYTIKIKEKCVYDIILMVRYMHTKWIKTNDLWSRIFFLCHNLIDNHIYDDRLKSDFLPVYREIVIKYTQKRIHSKIRSMCMASSMHKRTHRSFEFIVCFFVYPILKCVYNIDINKALNLIAFFL
jgi:hypothetical protein